VSSYSQRGNLEHRCRFRKQNTAEIGMLSVPDCACASIHYVTPWLNRESDVCDMIFIQLTTVGIGCGKFKMKPLSHINIMELLTVI
jgi:hypothetical protein